MSPILMFFTYLILVSMVTILVFWWDNRAHTLRKRPVPERLMLFLVAIGGTFGAWRAMSMYSHKNRKSSFRTQMGVIIFAQIMLILYLVFIQIPPELIDEFLGRVR